MQVQQELERFSVDADYFDQHRQELLARYPDRWVAVYNQQVVGAAKDMKRLVKQLDRKGVPSARTYVEYLTEKQEILIVFCARL